MSETLIKTKQVIKTPFTLVQKDGETMVVIGNNVAKSGFATFEDAENDIHENPWEYIPVLVAVIMDKMREITSNQKQK